MSDNSKEHPMVTREYPIRPLKPEEVAALYELADNGPLHCDCESSPDLCCCSTIMMLCLEWMKLKGLDPQPVKTAP